MILGQNESLCSNCDCKNAGRGPRNPLAIASARTRKPVVSDLVRLQGPLTVSHDQIVIHDNQLYYNRILK